MVVCTASRKHVPTKRQLLGYIQYLGACGDAKRWVQANYDPTALSQALESVPIAMLEWLAMDLDLSMQTVYDATVKAARERLHMANAEADAAFDEALETLSDAYCDALSGAEYARRGTCESSFRIYDAACDAAFGINEAAMQPARDAYATATGPARVDYDATVLVARGVYLKALRSDTFINEFIAYWLLWRTACDSAE
jgi:hypothetical protein